MEGITKENINDLTELLPELKNITDLKNLFKQDPNKWNELPVAVRFIRYLKKICKIEYVLSKNQPSQNEEVDILICEKNNSEKILKLQIQVADAEMAASINKQLSKNKPAEFQRITRINTLEPRRQQWFIQTISKKKYSRDSKTDLILLLNGWYKLVRSEFNEKKLYYKDCSDSGFKEIWIIYVNGYCHQLYP